MEHGKPGFVSVPGQVQQMVIGFCPAYPADLVGMGHGHGQRVLRVIHSPMFHLESVRQVGHPLKRSVHGTLEQFTVDFLPVADFHCVDRRISRQLNIRAGGKGQFLFSEIRTLVTH